MSTKGLIYLITGNGKGKTTAAMGLMLRAVGHGKKVCVIQFIKGNTNTGEAKAANQFGEYVDFYTLGKGFTWKSENIEDDITAAKKAWAFAGEIINDPKYSMVILDELTYLIKYGIVDEDQIIEKLSHKNDHLHIVITGRYEGVKLHDLCDTVSEIKEVKHHYNNGVKAQKGIEF